MDRPRNFCDVPSYADQIIEHAVNISGNALVVAEVDHELSAATDHTNRYVQWSLARSDSPFHVLKYHESRRSYRVHYLLHMSYEISRLWSIPSGERTAVAPIPQGSIGEDVPPGPWDDVGTKARDFLYARLNGTPMWLRIERELWQEVPEHRERQKTYLGCYVQTMDDLIVKTWSPDNEHPAYLAAVAMAMLKSEELALLAGVSRKRISKPSRLGSMVDDLAELLDDVREPGYRGDKCVIESWADYLGLKHRYEWKPKFE